MKSEDMIVLGLALGAVLLILKSGGVLGMPQAFLPVNRRKSTTGLSYDPGPGYGDTSKYSAYAAKAITNGGWGIE